MLIEVGDQGVSIDRHCHRWFDSSSSIGKREPTAAAHGNGQHENAHANENCSACGLSLLIVGAVDHSLIFVNHIRVNCLSFENRID